MHIDKIVSLINMGDQMVADFKNHPDFPIILKVVKMPNEDALTLLLIQEMKTWPASQILGRDKDEE